jgi:hypothetical protein
MRSLEVHYFETERDLTLALGSGLVLPEQLASTDCSECEDKVCYSDPVCEFTPFVLVVDENDQDWVVCEPCASPILDYVDAFFPPVVRSHFQDIDTEELDFF